MSPMGFGKQNLKGVLVLEWGVERLQEGVEEFHIVSLSVQRGAGGGGVPGAQGRGPWGGGQLLMSLLAILIHAWGGVTHRSSRAPVESHSAHATLIATDSVTMGPCDYSLALRPAYHQECHHTAAEQFGASNSGVQAFIPAYDTAIARFVGCICYWCSSTAFSVHGSVSCWMLCCVWEPVGTWC